MILAKTTAALCALGLLTSCGGDSGAAGSDVASLDDGTTPATTDGDDAGETSPADREEAMLEFTECMRDRGIDMPDPEFSGEGGGGMIEMTADPEDEGFQEAQEACQPILEDAMGEIELDPEQEAEMREQLLEFAECMRDHGIDMPDPVFDGEGRVTMRAEAGERFEPGVDDEAFTEASEECGREGPGMVFNGESAADEGEDG